MDFLTVGTCRWYLPFQLGIVHFWERSPDLLAWHSCAETAFGVCAVLDNWSPVCYFKFSSMKYWVGKCDGWQRSCTELLLFPTCRNPWSTPCTCGDVVERVLVPSWFPFSLINVCHEVFCSLDLSCLFSGKFQEPKSELMVSIPKGWAEAGEFLFAFLSNTMCR